MALGPPTGKEAIESGCNVQADGLFPCHTVGIILTSQSLVLPAQGALGRHTCVELMAGGGLPNLSSVFGDKCRGDFYSDSTEMRLGDTEFTPKCRQGSLDPFMPTGSAL